MSVCFYNNSLEHLEAGDACFSSANDGLVYMYTVLKELYAVDLKGQKEYLEKCILLFPFMWCPFSTQICHKKSKNILFVFRVTIMRDKDRKSRGVAFVLFLERDSAYQAVRALNRTQVS